MGDDLEDHDRLPTEWHPKRDVVMKLCDILGTQAGDYRMHVEELGKLSNLLDFNCYLCFIFTQRTDASVEVRVRAGLKLRNHIRKECPVDHMPRYMTEYIKNNVLSCMGVPNQLVRSTVANIVSTILYSIGFEGWPGLLQGLFHRLSHEKPEMLDGALLTLSMICEDHGADLIDHPQSPLDRFIPKWIDLMTHQIQSIRLNALKCLNEFILEHPGALTACLQNFLRALFRLTKDPSVEVCRQVCECFIQLLSTYPDQLTDHISHIIQFMLKASRAPSPELALSACSFWPRLAVSSLNIIAFENEPELLRQLIAVLLHAVMIPDSDILIELAAEKGSTPDLQKDIAPISYRTNVDLDTDDEATDSDDDSYDDGADETEGSQWGASDWTLRKCAAFSLDRMAVAHGASFLKLLLPLIQPGNRPQAQWKHLEASLLALGAVAIGCARPMKEHLPKLLPFITNQLKHPHPLVRSSACWTIQRYSGWIIDQPDSDKFYRPVLFALLTTLCDDSKHVQWFCCVAFRVLQSFAREMVTPYLPAVVQRFHQAFNIFQTKNTLCLMQTVGALADSVGTGLRSPPVIERLMAPLLEKWKRLPHGDIQLWMLFSCLTSLAIAFGPMFSKYALPVYSRCLHILENEHKRAEQRHPDYDFEESKVARIYSIDLISGIAEALRNTFTALIQPSSEKLVALLIANMEEPDPQLRQSSFSLAGDMARFCIPLPPLDRQLPRIVKTLIAGVDIQEATSVCNNAAWALSEIALKVGPKMNALVPSITERMATIITCDQQNLPLGLFQNVTLALGRIALIYPQIAVERIRQFFSSFCMILCRCPDDIDKEQAIRGLIRIVALNPEAIQQSFPLLCEVFVSWNCEFSPDLYKLMINILGRFRSASGSAEKWKAYYYGKAFPAELRHFLKVKFNFE